MLVPASVDNTGTSIIFYFVGKILQMWRISVTSIINPVWLLYTVPPSLPFRTTIILHYIILYYMYVCVCGGTWCCSWLRHCATSGKVRDSIPDGVIEIFHWHNPSARTMAMGSTRPITEMTTRNSCWGVKAAGALGWQPYHPHVANIVKSGSLNLLEASGPLQACTWIALPFFLTCFYVGGWGGEYIWFSK